MDLFYAVITLRGTAIYNHKYFFRVIRVFRGQLFFPFESLSGLQKFLTDQLL
jgi:hypothetical protein